MDAQTDSDDQESAFAKYARATEPERIAARQRGDAMHDRRERGEAMRQVFDETLQEAARGMSPMTFRHRLRRALDLDS
jgi:hypothetical protein